MLNKIFVQEAPTAIAMFDTEMRYIAASQKWLADYGLTGQDITGKSHYDVLPEIGEDWKEIHRQCLAGGVNKNSEAYFRRTDGSEQWLEWEVRPWYQPDGSVGGIIMYTADITERYRIKQQLLLSEEQFRNAFEYSPTGMALVSLDAQWVRVNSAMCSILGYNEGELTHLTTRDITHPDDLEEDMALATELLAGARTHYQREKRYIHKDGHDVWVILSASLIRNSNGEPLYCIAQVTDITESKRKEAEIKELLAITRDQNERLRNFAHIVTHNLRSHSGNIGILIDLFLQEHPEMNDNELIQSQIIASNNLKETIAHLNEVVAMDTAVDQNLKNLNLHQYVDKAIHSIAALAAEAGVVIENRVDEELHVQGVEAYLDSIILNFLTNGIKYRDEAKDSYIRLATSLTPDYVILSITDNGLGMDMKLVRQKLFGMYKTFHGNTDARGVGLYITKNQVEAIGGKIEADSTPQLGTTFNIYFRQARVAADVPVAS